MTDVKGLFLFSVFDSKVGAFAAPFLSRTKGEAVRSFTEIRRDPQSMVNKYPGDYRLFCVGVWDESVGVISPRAPELVIGADEL